MFWFTIKAYVERHNKVDNDEGEMDYVYHDLNHILRGSKLFSTDRLNVSKNNQPSHWSSHLPTNLVDLYNYICVRV